MLLGFVFQQNHISVATLSVLYVFIIWKNAQNIFPKTGYDYCDRKGSQDPLQLCLHI